MRRIDIVESRQDLKLKKSTKPPLSTDNKATSKPIDIPAVNKTSVREPIAAVPSEPATETISKPGNKISTSDSVKPSGKKRLQIVEVDSSEQKVTEITTEDAVRIAEIPAEDAVKITEITAEEAVKATETVTAPMDEAPTEVASVEEKAGTDFPSKSKGFCRKVEKELNGMESPDIQVRFLYLCTVSFFTLYQVPNCVRLKIK